MISPTDLIHPPPTPHFKTFQLFLIYCLKSPSFSTYKVRYEKKKKKCILFHMQKYHLFLSDFNKSWIFPTDFQKILKYEISWKSIHWEPGCSTRMDWRTGMMKLRVAFPNFVNTSNKKKRQWKTCNMYSFTTRSTNSLFCLNTSLAQTPVSFTVAILGRIKGCYRDIRFWCLQIN